MLKCAGAPTLRQTQCMKWRRTTRGKRKYKNAADLWSWAAQHTLPANKDDMEDDTLYAVPQDWPAYDETEGICLTGRKQVGWMLQVLEMGKHTRFGVKCDGKHKFHHGKWIIVTVGVHTLVFNEIHKVLVQVYHSSFMLVYVVCACMQHGCNGMQVIV